MSPAIKTGIRKSIATLNGLFSLSKDQKKTDPQQNQHQQSPQQKNQPQDKSSKKKILILSGNIGNGHTSAANAIKEAIAKTYSNNFEVEIIDFMDFMNSTLNKVSQKTYDGANKFMPGFIKFNFDFVFDKWPLKFFNQINYPFVLSKVTKLFEEKSPNLIISTFPIWDYLAAGIWKKCRHNAKFISVVTDSIAIHHGWVIADSDYHIVANRDTAITLQNLGVKPRKIKVLGFPVRLKFMEEIDQNDFLKKNDLDPDLFTILFLPAAQNPAKNVKIMKELVANQHDYNLIVITGRDTKIKSKLEKLIKNKNTKILGWTEQMPEYIKTADLIVTKAGGATIMECIAAKKPMVITSTIPGQEEGNAELIKRHQLGVVPAATAMSVNESIEYIRRNYPRFQRNLQKNSNPESAIKIAKFIKNLV